MKLEGRHQIRIQRPIACRRPALGRAVANRKLGEGSTLSAAPPRISTRRDPNNARVLGGVPPAAKLISRKQIRAYCDAIVSEFRPEKIVLFGSYAYGQPTPDSDVDLLVVLRFRGSDVAKALQIRSWFDTPFPLDLLVRKPEFVSARLLERDMFIELVMSRGVTMYESEHA